MNWHKHSKSWSFILRAYLPRLAACSLAWEILQLPLYTLWSMQSPARIAYAVAHCTAGDIMIGTSALLAALMVTGANGFADWQGRRIVPLMVLLTVAFTIVSERSNLASGSWAYSPSMPLLPGIEVGLSPMLQWVLVPIVAWRWACRR